MNPSDEPGRSRPGPLHAVFAEHRVGAENCQSGSNWRNSGSPAFAHARLPPKRELRLGKPREGCRAEARRAKAGRSRLEPRLVATPSAFPGRRTPKAHPPRHGITVCGSPRGFAVQSRNTKRLVSSLLMRPLALGETEVGERVHPVIADAIECWIARVLVHRRKSSMRRRCGRERPPPPRDAAT